VLRRADIKRLYRAIAIVAGSGEGPRCFVPENRGESATRSHEEVTGGKRALASGTSARGRRPTQSVQLHVNVRSIADPSNWTATRGVGGQLYLSIWITFTLSVEWAFSRIRRSACSACSGPPSQSASQVLMCVDEVFEFLVYQGGGGSEACVLMAAD